MVWDIEIFAIPWDGMGWYGMRPLTPIPLWVGMGFYWYRPMGRGISGISHGMWLNVAEM